VVIWLYDNLGETLVNIGIASRHERLEDSFKHVPGGPELTVIDVSDLVETGGNDPQRLREKLIQAKQALATDSHVIVVCDKGIVRSSMFAMKLLTETGVEPTVALAKVVEKVGSQAINLDLIQDLQKATRKKRILVTGGTGFIGSNLIPTLSQHYQVVSYPRAGLNLVDSPFELHKVVEAHNVDLIIHLAHPRAHNLLPSMPEAILMMRNVLEVCRVKNLPLIYLSSLAVFSEGTYDHRSTDKFPECRMDLDRIQLGPCWLSPDDVRVPEGVYGQTKYLCEQLAETYWLAHDVKTTVLRPSFVYGKGMDEDSVISKFIQRAKRNEPLIVHQYKNGCQVFDFLHINDLIRAIMLAVEQPGVGPLNIGTGVGTSIRELAEVIVEATASKSEVQIVPVSRDAPRRVVDPVEADRALNWKSRIALRDGLLGMIVGCGVDGL